MNPILSHLLAGRRLGQGTGKQTQYLVEGFRKGLTFVDTRKK